MGKLKKAEALIEKTIRDHPERLDLEAIPPLTDEEKTELASSLRIDEWIRTGRNRMLKPEENRRFFDGVWRPSSRRPTEPLKIFHQNKD